LRKPCGGFLLITANSIIHIDQGHVGHTAMVNKFCKRTTHLKMSQVLSNSISLERSISISLDPQEVVFILKGGEIYRLGLRMDGKRLNRMIWELLGKSVPATSGIALDDSPRIFLGSELSKSCMIKFEKSHIRNVTVKQEKTDIFNHLKANDNTEVDIDLYGHDKPSQDSQQPKKMIKTDFDWEFKIEHEISNLGPINDYSIGPSHHVVKDKKLENALIPHDVLLCSGVGKYGSLNIVNQHIYPESGNSFSLPGCKGLWTLKSATEEMHDHLIISKSDRTLVLSSGDELQEIKAHKLYSQGPTIALGEFPSFRVFVQVYKTGLRLIDSKLNTLICSKTVARNRTADMWVSSASVLEPYVLLHHQSGSVTLLKYNNEASELVTIEPKFDDNQKKFQCGALFSGSTDLFVPNEQLIKSNSQLLNKRTDKSSSDLNNQNSINDGARKLSAAEIEQEDLDLYGTGAVEDTKSTPTANSPTQLSPRTDPDIDHVKPTTSEIFLTLIDPSGNMQLFSLPSGELCALFPKISLVPTLLNQIESQASSSATVSSSDVDFNEIEFFNVEEKLYMILGSVTTEIFLYEFFLDRSLPIHSPWIVDHPNKLATKLNRVSINFIPDIENETSQEANIKRFFPFKNISGRSGVFVLDKEPSWIIGNGQRGVNRYPTRLPNDIVSFSAYNTSSCSNGFVYCTKSGNLKTCQLPSGFEYEFQWTHKTIPMDRNPQKITHHLGSNTYLLASSNQQPFGLVEDSTVQQNQDSNDPIEILTKFYDSNNPPPYLPTNSKYQLDLISPLTWKPVDTFEFNDNEIVSCICSADLETKQTQSGRKNYIVVGTIISMGEDLAVKGKLYVFDVIEVVPEPGKPETGHKLKKIAVIDAKGPVTALAHSQGYLFTGMGNKLIMRKFEDDTTLEGVAFFDLQVYITTITVCKNFLLVGDLYKSAWFLGFQLEPTKIILLGKDYHPCQVMSSEILIQNNIMNFLISDELGNDIVLSYNPNNLQSFSGNKLVFKGDFHTNRRVVKWMRIPAKSIESSDDESSLTNTFYCLGGNIYYL
jgi:cleavage and polyadenylation specificity factor subunit 1